MPVISELRGQGRKEALEFQASLGYIVSSSKISTGYTVRPCLKIKYKELSS